MSRKFVPVEPYSRVTFAARGSDSIVVVPAEGLTLPETEPREVTAWDEESGTYVTETQDVEINQDLFLALAEHPQVKEVPVGNTPPPPPPPPPADEPKE